MSASVCLCACVYVCLWRAYLQKLISNLHQMLCCACFRRSWLGPSLAALRCYANVLPVLDDSMFAHSGQE